jgi:TIR domain-containing protein
MRLLDTLSVYYKSEERRIGIYEGDLTELTPEEAVDVLVVSAYPNDYAPTPGSLIGALHRKGVSVHELAGDKASDLRGAFSCWMSREIETDDPGIQFKRILCFEPLVRGKPPEVVGDIFRSLGALMGDDPPIHSVAMPLVATGDQHIPAGRMIDPLLDAAVHWMAIGLPLTELKIVARSRGMVEDLAREFLRLKEKYADFGLAPSEPAYDLFVSYSHENTRDASLMVEQLKQLRPGLRVFFDRLTLDKGSAWQQEVYEAIDASRRFLSLFSPSYLESKICLEEFNIALHRRRDTGKEIVFPVFLYTATLPTYMRALVDYEDCREGDPGKLRAACEKLLSEA